MSRFCFQKWDGFFKEIPQSLPASAFTDFALIPEFLRKSGQNYGFIVFYKKKLTVRKFCL